MSSWEIEKEYVAWNLVKHFDGKYIFIHTLNYFAPAQAAWLYPDHTTKNQIKHLVIDVMVEMVIRGDNIDYIYIYTYIY